MHVAWKRASPRKHGEGSHLPWRARARPTFPRRRRLVHLLVWTSPLRVKVIHGLPALHPPLPPTSCARLFYVEIESTLSPVRTYRTQSSRRCGALVSFVPSLEIPLRWDGRARLATACIIYFASPFVNCRANIPDAFSVTNFPLSFHITSQYLQPARSNSFIFIHDRIYVTYIIAKLI